MPIVWAEGEVHLTPDGADPPHENSLSCPCGPQASSVGTVSLVIHQETAS